jgi:hypothetical protein
MKLLSTWAETLSPTHPANLNRLIDYNYRSRTYTTLNGERFKWKGTNKLCVSIVIFSDLWNLWRLILYP